MLLYYIRHGDPIYDPDSLTPLGKRQAEAVGRRLALHGMDAVYASSSNRAIQTAAPACEMLHLKPVILDWCNEAYAWRDLTVTLPNGGTTWVFQCNETIRRLVSPEVTALGHKWYTHPCFAPNNGRFEKGIETIRQNTFAFLSEQGYDFDSEKGAYLCREPNDRRIALFAHQGFGLAFLSCLLNIPYCEMATRFDLGHSSMTVINFQDFGGWCVPVAEQVSNDSHIYKEDLPTKYQNFFYI